jgi:lysophospholipase L1-like esterase
VLAAAASLTAAALAACGAATPSSPIAAPRISAPGAPIVYVALGASESAGTGIDDNALRLRAAWPQLFFNDALPRAATYYNFALSGTTTAAALTSELPPALSVHPDLATVFFTLDDLVRGVSPAEYESNLDEIVRQLRRGGRTTVLVANAPHVDNLPAYRACMAPSDTTPCPLGLDVVVPPPAVVDAAIDVYNAAVKAVATRNGAIVVDLAAHGADLVGHPEDVAADGFHPSPLGAAAIASLFVSAYRAHVH